MRVEAMTDASQDRAIGRIEGQLKQVLSELQDAKASRKQTYEKLDKLDRKIDATETKVESIDKRLEKVEEPVAEFSRWRERGVGAIMLISFAAASFGGLLATFGKKLWALLTGG